MDTIRTLTTDLKAVDMDLKYARKMITDWNDTVRRVKSTGAVLSKVELEVLLTIANELVGAAVTARTFAEERLDRMAAAERFRSEGGLS